MARSGRIRIVNLLVLAVVLAALWFLYFRVLLHQQKIQESLNKIALAGSGFDRDYITNLELLYNDGTNYNITKLSLVSNTWQLRFPVAGKADNGSAANIIDSLPGLVSERVITNSTPAEISNYGFDRPVIIIRFSGGVPGPMEILCGGMDSTGKFFYTEVNGDKSRIYLVYAYKFNQFAKSWNDFRDHDIFTIPIENINVFTLTAGGTNFTFDSIKNSNTFTMVSPVNMPVDSFSVKSKILDLTGLKISRFINNPGPLESYGLNPPAYHAGMVSFNGETIELNVGTTDSTGAYYGESSGKVLFLIDSPGVDNIFKIKTGDFIQGKRSN